MSHKIEPYKRYSFGPAYTLEYMMEVVVRLQAELNTRRDITPAWSRELDQMRRYLEDDRPKQLGG